MINIRKLAAVDMALHGTRLITAEFALGIILPLVLGLLSIRTGLASTARLNWDAIVGWWLVGTSVNYIPLFIYALLLAKGGTVHTEGQPEIAHIMRYTAQQLIIFVPLLVVVLSIVQELSRRARQARGHG